VHFVYRTCALCLSLKSVWFYHTCLAPFGPQWDHHFYLLEHFVCIASANVQAYCPLPPSHGDGTTTPACWSGA
jgi:hypothetical protein